MPTITIDGKEYILTPKDEKPVVKKKQSKKERLETYKEYYQNKLITHNLRKQV